MKRFYKTIKMAFIQKISFDALVGPDCSTLEWQEEMGAKIQVEGVVRDMLEKIVEDSERLPVARVLFAEHENDSDSDLGITDEEDEENLWIDTSRSEIRRCEVCSQNEWTIWERIRTGQGDPVDSLREHEGRLICGCCQEMLGTPLSEHKICCNCFVLTEWLGIWDFNEKSVGGNHEEQRQMGL